MPLRLSANGAEDVHQLQNFVRDFFTFAEISTKRNYIEVAIQCEVSLTISHKEEPVQDSPALSEVYIGQHERINPLKSHCN